MPCGRDSEGTLLGSCCAPLGIGRRVRNACFDCIPQTKCVGIDCTSLTGTPNSWIEAAGDMGWLTIEPPDFVWHAGQTCAEVAGDSNVPCGVSSACCHQGHVFNVALPAPINCEEAIWSCGQIRSDICHRGYMVGGDQSGAVTGGRHCRVKMQLTSATVRSQLGVRIDLQTGRPAPFLECYRSAVQGPGVACHCEFNNPPFLTQDTRDLGFSRCLRLPQSFLDWEDTCDLGVSDGLFCQHMGFPLVIDDDGVAAWDASNRKLDETPGAECEHVLADLYLDTAGEARSISCTRRGDETRPPGVTIGHLSYQADIPPGECVTVYQDFRWDNDFDCGD